jgi:hypothetical protein
MANSLWGEGVCFGTGGDIKPFKAPFGGLMGVIEYKRTGYLYDLVISFAGFYALFMRV